MVKSKCKFELLGDVCIMTTTNGTQVLLDTQDYEKVKDHTWSVIKSTNRISTSINNKIVKLPRFLLDVTDSNAVIDHINGNRLDNRRNNLRICTVAENVRNRRLQKNNTTGYVGLRYTKYGRWNARIMLNKKRVDLGTYKTKEEAIKARQEAEKKYYGEFAPCKNIDYFAQYMNPPSEE